MYGAIIGDIVGSKYEFNNIKTKDFPFVSEGCFFTDDTIMTVAVAKALMCSIAQKCAFKGALVEEMQRLGKEYPDASYGGMFARWLTADNPAPYNSFGNGSAMRVSPCGLIAVTLDEATTLARASAEVTHDHPEGIKGAEAVAAAVFLAKTGQSKEQIGAYIRENYYDLSKSIDEIRSNYSFDETCAGCVPPAIQAFLESVSYEDAIRNAVSIGGDSDTIAAITGAVAWSYYRFNMHTDDRMSDTKPQRIWRESCDAVIAASGVDRLLPREFTDVIEEFDIIRMQRAGVYDRTGYCSVIKTQ